MDQLSHPPRALAAVRFFRQSTVGALAGLIVGVLVGGLGSRLVMRASAVAGGPAVVGRVTQNGNVVGRFTVDGTVGLILFGGAFFGLAGGLLYVAVRRWLPGPPRWRGLVFGGILLAVFGSLVIEGNNPDFVLFRPPLLNIGLFALLFMVFGLGVAPLAERFDRSFPPANRTRIPVFVAYVPLTVVSLLGLPAAGGLVGGDGAELLAGLRMLPYGLAVVPTAARLGASVFPRSTRRSLTALAYGLLAVPLVLGLFLDARAIAEILVAAGRTR